MDILEQYAILDSQIKSLLEKKEEMRTQILPVVIEAGKKGIETPFGKFSYSSTKKWTYPQYIVDQIDELEGIKAKAQETGEATYTESESFKFNPVKI